MVEARDTAVEDVGDKIRALADELGPLPPVAPNVFTGPNELRRKLIEELGSLQSFSAVGAGVRETLSADYASIGKSLAPTLDSVTVALPDEVTHWVPPEVTMAGLLRELVEIQQAEHETNEKRARRTERWAIVAAGTGIAGCVIAVAQLII
jgi:hypothetical protein